MKRILAMLLVLLAPTAIVAGAVIYVASRGLPQDAHAALDGYLAYRYYDRELTPLIRREILATKPWLLGPEQSGPTFGEGVFYHTTVNFGALASRDARWPSTPVASQEHYSEVNSLRALPYPPEEIWCILLDSKDLGENMVLVAAHMDIYNARWIVHEMPTAWTAARVNALLSDLGCGVN